MQNRARIVATLGPWLALLACGESAESGPAAPGASGSGGSAAVVAGAGGSGGGVSAGSTSGGNAPSSGGGGNSSASGGQAGSSTGGGGGSAAGSAGAGGQSGPTPPEGVPADYTLALDLPFATEADLSSILAANQNAWTFDGADGGALSFTGQGYTAPAPVNESLSSFAIIPGTLLSSFVLDVELAQLNPNQTEPHRDLCIVFNAADHKHFLYAHIAQTHDERSHNIHLIDNAPREPITATHNGGIMWGTAGTWHQVRLVRDAEAGAISVFMDGNLQTPVLTATDTTRTSGYLGFGTYLDSGKIRKLKVWTKGAQQVPAQGFFTQ
jgi:hypothetical protein